MIESDKEMNIRSLLLAVLLMSFAWCNAQSEEDIRKQINNIKKSSSYIYGEATADTEAEARGIAEEILYQEINSWAAKKKKLQGGNFVVNNKKELMTYYSLKRGCMMRSFVYVKKSDIVSQPAQAHQGEMPASAASPSLPAPVFPQAVKTIASYTDYAPMAAKIVEMKKTGEIRSYARYASLEKPELYYLVVYNPQGKVVAVLSPGQNRINVQTGQSDKVTNYSGCGAIGFTVNE